jgi:hypothetical protein
MMLINILSILPNEKKKMQLLFIPSLHHGSYKYIYNLYFIFMNYVKNTGVLKNTIFLRLLFTVSIHVHAHAVVDSNSHIDNRFSFAIYRTNFTGYANLS